MKRVPIAGLEAGMVVVEDVYNRNGEIVIPQNAQLTEKSIKLLEGWGVPSVAVEGEEEDVLKRFTPEQVAEVEKEVNGKFVESAKENPFIASLAKLCVLRRLNQKFATPAKKEEAKKEEAKP